MPNYPKTHTREPPDRKWNGTDPPLDCHNVIRLSKQASTQERDQGNEQGLKCLTVCWVLSLEEMHAEVSSAAQSQGENS